MSEIVININSSDYFNLVGIKIINSIIKIELIKLNSIKKL